MKKRFIFLLASVCPLAVLLAGCASIVKGSSPNLVSIQSSPEGVRFVVKNNQGIILHNGRTPATVSLKASDGYFQRANYIIVFTKASGGERIVPLSASVRAWYVAGNLFFGGLIGWLIVDPATGAMWTLEDEVVNVAFGDDEVGQTQNALHIASIDDVPSSLHHHMKPFTGAF